MLSGFARQLLMFSRYHPSSCRLLVVAVPFRLPGRVFLWRFLVCYYPNGKECQLCAGSQLHKVMR